jgi:hypothetical protein
MVALVVPIAAAADTSGATYTGIIQVSNNSTATTNVATVLSLKTPALIAGAYVDGTLSNVSLQSGTGTDLAFMPGGSDNSSWSVWVPSIGQNTSLSDVLYTGGPAMGGKVRYFPGASGMTSTDHATLELGGNWEIEQSGMVNTDSGGGNLAYKAGAVRTFTDDGVIVSEIQTATTLFSETTAGASLALYNGSSTRAGQFLSNTLGTNPYVSPFTGTIASATLYLSKSGGPTGTATVNVRNIDTDAVIGTLGTRDVSTLTGVATAYAFSTPVTVVNANVAVVVEYTGGDGGNYINAWYVAANNIIGTRAYYQGSWTGNVTTDATIVVTTYPSVAATGLTSGEKVVETSYQANLVSNSSFETGTPPTGWGTGGDPALTFTRDSSKAVYGSNSARVVCTDTSVHVVGQSLAGLSDGMTITIGAWVWSSTANIGYLTTWGGAFSSAHPGDSQWHWLSVTNTTTGGNHYAYLVMTGVGTAYFDGVIVVLGSSLRNANPNQYYNLNLYLDGAFTAGAAVDGNVTVADNANGWTFAEASAMPYMAYHKVWTSTVLRQHIVWQYAATFTDQSGSGMHATPTFRSASSDADVSASLVAFAPVAQAQTGATGSSSAPDVVAPPDAIADLYTELAVTLPLADAINGLLDGAEIPRALFWFPILMLGVLVVSFLAYWATRNTVVKAVVIWLAAMMVAALNGWGWWLLIPLAVELTAVAVAQKKAGW